MVYTYKKLFINGKEQNVAMCIHDWTSEALSLVTKDRHKRLHSVIYLYEVTEKAGMVPERHQLLF